MFTSELCLQNKFIQLKEAELNKNEKILTEFNARFGNVDMVQVFINDSNLLSYDQANLLSSYQFAKVLAFLHKKAIRTFSYLQKCTDYGKKMLSSILSKLIKANIVTEINSNRYIISEEFEFPMLQFISYEAKLQKWKKAILQASINKKFSSYSYVVLPIELAYKLKQNKINYFHTYNVGLIGVSDNKIEYLFNPKKETLKFTINPSLISSIAKYQIETSTFSISAQ
ncbi:hypothetical protein KQI46_02325 [Lysinibacillus capsici]|uniref:hypothetical protein n=1 Tax=Lysinibacillus capsici TaxID=2115968 RepID=UPI001C1282CE|nr:hypothetical protein [Lysinibacillus capsici]MBU5250776.1 hypothetical protein [Lysinibacillus capsici]